MEFTGRIYRVLPKQKGVSSGGNEWERQDFIFEYFEKAEDRWSDKVVLSALNSRIDEYDLHEGDEVKIGFSHSVKEYNGRWFNELHVYRFEKIVKAVEPVAKEPEPQAPVKPAEETNVAEKADDLPF